jgi:serine protease
MPSFFRFVVPFALSLSVVGVSLPVSVATAQPDDDLEVSVEDALKETLEEVAEPRAAGQIMVTYAPGASDDDRARVRSVARSAETLLDDVDLLWVDENEMVDVLVDLKVDDAVLGAEPDRILATATDLSNFREVDLSAMSVPTDPGVSIPEAWGMQGPYAFGNVPSSQYGSNATEAWYQGYRGTPEGIIAVIDSGVDISHPDLAANIWKNTKEIANNGRDDDNNGFIDDVNGWNFFHNTNRVYMDAEEDQHGTHVAGTIAAVANNGIGIAGIAPNTKILPVKFLGPKGQGTTSGAVQAVNYVVTMKKGGAPITAINASWGGPSYSSALATAITAAGNENILVVAAAGNDGVSTPFYPAAQTCTTKWGVDCVISVAAHDEYGNITNFSNYGTSIVDISAPGDMILSTIPAGKYAFLDGTSMAAPHVAAVISTCRGIETVLTLEEKRASVLTTGTPRWQLSNYVGTGSALDVAAVAASCGDARMPKMDYVAPLESIETVTVSSTLVPHGRVKTGTWSVGAAPAGVSIGASSGVLSYTPQKFGEYTATVTLRNAQGVSTSSNVPLRAYVYSDVASGAYFEEGVHWLRINQITNGTSPTTFGPTGAVTRAQMAAFLWRAAGSPSSPAPCGFLDQSSIPAYARSAACWLKANNITTNNPFNPNGTVDRAQMAAFLWRAAGSPSSPAPCGFLDQSSIPAYARSAACWLKANNITTNNPFGPTGPVTRAQMAAFLWRAAGSPS